MKDMFIDFIFLAAFFGLLFTFGFYLMAYGTPDAHSFTLWLASL